jgi:hypothetical protein
MHVINFLFCGGGAPWVGSRPAPNKDGELKSNENALAILLLLVVVDAVFRFECQDP